MINPLPMDSFVRTAFEGLALGLGFTTAAAVIAAIFLKVRSLLGGDG
jgi:hypothetical protein